jgi:hypothetical protein
MAAVGADGRLMTDRGGVGPLPDRDFAFDEFGRASRGAEESSGRRSPPLIIAVTG